MAGKLVALTGMARGLILNLSDGHEWVVGRDPEAATLLVEEPSVSRRHLLIKETGGELFVENLSETNPALLNGDPINGATTLKEGDRLLLGNQELLFTFEEPPEVTIGEAPIMQPEEEKAPPAEEEPKEPSRESILGEEGGEAGLTEVHFDLLETGRWVLKVVGGPNNGAEFPLQAGSSYVIGTDPSSCDIVFHDISVSRQHARLTLSENDKLSIEDLGSRNGTFMEDVKVEGKTDLEPNKLVTLGTSTFVILDVEGERSTIISPLMPSIVKVLQKAEVKEEEPKPEPPPVVEEEKEKKPPFSLLGAFILIALISGLFAVIGIGLSTLFKGEAIQEQHYDFDKEIGRITASYPAVRYSFNEGTGRVLLVGHVLTPVDRSQLVYNLQALPFVKSVDDNIIIDELVWKEVNQDLAKNPDWRGVSMISPEPGKFALTGSLQSKKQSEGLSEYINQNFSYPDLLDNRVVVEEDLLAKTIIILRNNGFGNIRPSFSDGEIKLIGKMGFGMKQQLDTALSEISKLPGVRTVQNLVIEQKAVDSAINISDKYHVSGATGRGGQQLNVIINGRILNIGDTIDGMTVTSIQPEAVYLEKEGVRYRIDYNK